VTSPKQRGRDLAARIRVDLAHRSAHGLWGNPLTLLLVLLTTSLLYREQFVLWASMGFLLLLSGLRWMALRGMRSANPLIRIAMDHVHLALVLTSAAFWGALAAWSVWRFGYRDIDTLILLLYHACIGYAVMSLLVHDLCVMRLALALLFLPPAISQLCFAPEQRWGPILSFAVYLLYAGGQGTKAHAIYMRQIEDHHDLNVMAHHDALTGLPNRLYVNRVLEEATQETAPFALCFIDFDKFKQINDRFSHRAGDLFLQEAAERVRQAGGDFATVARVGGDEFLIVLRCPSPREESARVGKRIMEALTAPIVVEGKAHACSASIGISLFPSDAREPSGLLRAADSAMYCSKNSGRGGYRFFNNETGEPAALELVCAT
jgi:diguanylate cyclase (GGDEF)-like protein